MLRGLIIAAIVFVFEILIAGAFLPIAKVGPLELALALALALGVGYAVQRFQRRPATR